jgi:CO/xanthine dehydrogenase Mo-binding subunit
MMYKLVGKSVPRVEGAEKVTGQTRYAADIDLPGALWVKILRSSLPHARILKVDTAKAGQFPGVRAVISGADIPPVLTGLRMKDMPVLARDRVRYAGEPVAAVAADSPEIAEEAAQLIEVDYEELPVVTDPIEAIRPGAPLLHDNPGAYKNAPERSTELPNVQSLGVWGNGDIEVAFEKAARVFEHTFRTPLGFHAYIEPHACAVRVGTDGHIEVWASNKSPFTLRDRMARDLNLDAQKIKVHILPVGGDFGGKTSVLEVPICYFLAERAGKPVKLVLNYGEELTAAPHRHPAVITLRTGVNGDGRLCAVQAKVVFGGGAYAALKANPEVTVQGPRRVANYYQIPAVEVETLCAYTNHPSCTQTRTPGAPQVVFAMESQKQRVHHSYLKLIDCVDHQYRQTIASFCQTVLLFLDASHLNDQIASPNTLMRHHLVRGKKFLKFHSFHELLLEYLENQRMSYLYQHFLCHQQRTSDMFEYHLDSPFF